jgi:hypothetical protein
MLLSGNWIRPINGAGNGALSMAQCCVPKSFDTFREPILLDILEIEFIEARPKTAQPENWLISNKSWKTIGNASDSYVDFIKQHVADDPELFRGYERFVSKHEIETRPPECSLVLVSPKNLHWTVERDQYGRRRISGRFTVCGATYVLPLTDDLYAEKFGDLTMHETVAHTARFSGETLLTISLGDLYEVTGRYYKLIARRD